VSEIALTLLESGELKVKGDSNAVDVAVMNPGLYKLDDTLVGVVKAVEVAVMNPGK